MSNLDDICPSACCALASGRRDPAAPVELLLDKRIIGALRNAPSPELTETLRLALSEILAGVFRYAGPDAGSRNAGLELWLQPGLLICVVRFHGSPLPGWLIANWDRMREPGQLACADDMGWGWLLVREAIDTVSYDRDGEAQLLFLEKRL